MKSGEKSKREPLVAVMGGRCEYHHKTFPGENPYFNINFRNERRRGDSFIFFNNIISGSGIRDIGMIGPGKNLGNTYGFRQMVING